MTNSRTAHDSRAVANMIMQIAQERGIGSLTIMQLVKLIYFAQGWSLAFCDRPITTHNAEAWKYGPVYPLVYKSFPNAGSSPLDSEILNPITDKPFVSIFTEDETNILNWVVEEYGKVHAFDLSKLTHMDGGPWKRAVDANGLYSEIPLSFMMSYFKQFLKPDGAEKVNARA